MPAIIYEKKGKVAYITLNRPQAFNAISPDLIEEMHRALVDFRDDNNAWVLILTGAGEKAFCAGADIKTLLPVLEAHWVPHPWEMPIHIARGLDIWKPTIAAINGAALGGGLEFALACDLRVAAENATLGLPEVRLGLLAGWGGTTRLSRYMPAAKAAELIFTGQAINAQEALRWGLVNDVVPLAGLLSRAEEYANKICEAGPLAVRAAKEIMRRGIDTTLTEAMKLEWQLLSGLFQSRDYVEGRQAFIEKRKPIYQGK